MSGQSLIKIHQTTDLSIVGTYYFAYSAYLQFDDSSRATILKSELPEDIFSWTVKDPCLDIEHSSILGPSSSVKSIDYELGSGVAKL